jgi:hypothetical protein
VELYTKGADKYHKEARQAQAKTSTGLPTIGKPMEKHAVRKKKPRQEGTEMKRFSEIELILVPLDSFQSLAALTNFRIPKRPLRTPEDSNPTPEFDTMTPGAGTSNEPGPELLKRARTIRFKGRLDKGGIGQQLVLAGYHRLPITEKLKIAAELDSVEAQVAPDAPQVELDALIQIYEKPYAKWGPAYATQLLTMFPKPKISLVGPAPRFK